MSKRRAKITPIFVDQTGRRRKIFAMVAAGTAVLLVTAMAVLIAGFVGVGPSSLPGLPDLNPAQHREGARLPANPEASSAVPAPNPSPANGSGASSPAPGPTATQETRGNRPTHTPGGGHPRPSRTK